MTNSTSLKLIARRLQIMADDMRIIHHAMGMPPELTDALENLRKAEAQILEAANK